ncbi:MAG TPA: glucoamylase family protein [Gemmatimonadaceae bacterium]|nr:glucoamylase family protein [Gemmatimonadaceae bacterium]
MMSTLAGRAVCRALPLILLLQACASGPGIEQPGTPRSPATQSITPRQAAFLDTLEQRTFNWFWEKTNPANGLTPDRWPTKSFSSVAAVGFALTAYPIGIERGYVTRSAAADRVLTTVRFMYTAPQGPQATGVIGHKGFFYHFLDMETGHRFEQVELSTIDTSLLLAGVLFCQSYFTQATPTETAIRAYADSLYRRVDWQWIRPKSPLVSMGWKPESGFIEANWHGLNEAIILNILALASPTFPLEPAAWTAYTSTYKWGDFYGQQHLNFAPLFGHQYSHIWIDFRGIRDPYMTARGIDYFENSRRATYSQRAYAIANPGGWKDYGASIWGLTAVDGPLDTVLVIGGRSRTFWTYSARGAAAGEIRDDGTIGPTATGGSIPFAPEITIPALVAMREKYGEHLFSSYGFLDSFNPTFDADIKPQHGKVVRGVGWFDTDYLGIDQGPIIAMIENYRSDLVWRTMRKNPHIVRGLKKAGFSGGWLDQQ